MNGYQVQNAWVKAAQGSRDEETRRRQQIDRDRTERQQRAVRVCAEQFPELCDDRGRPCGWLVWAFLDTASKAGGAPKRSAVLADRRRKLDALAARIGFDPTLTEGPA